MIRDPSRHNPGVGDADKWTPDHVRGDNVCVNVDSAWGESGRARAEQDDRRPHQQDRGSGEFGFAFAVAAAGDGTVFVADFANNRVQKWRPQDGR